MCCPLLRNRHLSVRSGLGALQWPVLMPQHCNLIKHSLLGHSAWLCLTWVIFPLNGCPAWKQFQRVTKLEERKHMSPSQMLAKANRERLAVLLEEARSGAGGDERYAASLR